MAGLVSRRRTHRAVGSRHPSAGGTCSLAASARSIPRAAGILYRSTGRLAEAEKAYTEALAIYRELAVTNPDVYGQRVTALTREVRGLKKGGD